MKKTITAILATVLVICFCMVASARGTTAVEGRKEVEVLRIDPEATTIQIDGELDDIWLGANQIKLETLQTDVSDSAAVVGQNIASCSVRLLWNGKNVLYMFFEVKDGGVWSESLNPWDCDAVVFATDWDNWKDGSSSGGRFERIQNDAGTGEGAAYKFSAKKTSDGYNVEVELITEEYVNGDYIGLDFELDDATQDGVRFAAIGWSSNTNDGWQTRAKYGQGLLSGTLATVPADEPEPDSPDTGDALTAVVAVAAVCAAVSVGIVIKRRKAD